METKVIQKINLEPYLEQLPIHPTVGMLFTGDRLSCIDYAVVIADQGKLVGLATIAPEGEGGGVNKPTIVGFFIMPEYRKQGYALQLLEATIDECVTRNLTPVHIQVMSGRLMNCINRLDEKKQGSLDIVDFGNIIDIWD